MLPVLSLIYNLELYIQDCGDSRGRTERRNFLLGERSREWEVLHGTYALALGAEVWDGSNWTGCREKAWRDQHVAAGRLRLRFIRTGLGPAVPGTLPCFPGNTNNQEADLFFQILRLYALTMAAANINPGFGEWTLHILCIRFQPKLHNEFLFHDKSNEKWKWHCER